MSTLVIIDMQSDFYESYTQDIIEAVEDCIYASNRRGDKIVLMELAGCGSTEEAIKNMLFETDSFTMVKKYKNNGYPRVRTNEHLKDSQYIVCGVNALYCVIQTIIDMVRDANVDKIIVPLLAVGDFSLIKQLKRTAELSKNNFYDHIPKDEHVRTIKEAMIHQVRYLWPDLENDFNRKVAFVEEYRYGD